MRFRPPAARFSVEVGWVLRRAFGPPVDARPDSLDSRAAVEAARALDLAPRIGLRTARARLHADLGEGGARTLRAAQGLAAVSATTLLDLARDVARTAAAHDIPAVFLKGIALHARGTVPIGARWLSDVDVLVPPASAERLDAALRASGFEQAPGSVESEHQLPPLRRGGQSVEIHRFLPGVTPPGRRGFATADDLARAGALEALQDWPAGSTTPNRSLLAAHALVHGIAQHGFAPRTYPLTRMLSDLVDLRFGEDEALLGSALAWTLGHVSAEEALATRDLCRSLVAGEIPEASPLLAHAVFGLTDDRYAASLKLRALGSGPSTQSRPIAFARDAWKAVFPGRDRLRGLYGSEGSDLARAAWRPLDLGCRLARTAWSAAALRLRAARPE
jgi:hypothetical protein